MDSIQRSDRFIGLSIAVFLIVLFGMLYLVFGFMSKGLFTAALLLFLAALLIPSILMPLNRIWLKLTGKLTVLNNYLLLGIFFFLIVLPMGMCLKIFGRDPMHRKLRQEDDSYWTEIHRQTDKNTLRDMF